MGRRARECSLSRTSHDAIACTIRLLESYNRLFCPIFAICDNPGARAASATLKAKNADMTERYDCIVVGLGGHGSAALYHLAQRGAKVLGIEQHTAAHDKGSSHGESRIIRIAYHEHPDYVPLLQRAWDLWLDLQKKSGKFLLCETKCIEAARPDFNGSQNCFTHALESAIEHNLEHETLTGDQVNARFPGYCLPSDFKALLGPGGILASERCIQAHLDLARQNGAEVKLNTAVKGWHTDRSSGDAVVVTSRGRYTAKKLILSAGAWMPQLVPELQAVLQIERQVIAWFDILQKGCCHRESFPVGIVHDSLGEFYYFPEFEKPGMKIGKFYHLRERVEDPAKLERDISAADEQVLREGIAKWFPAANGKMLDAAACMFTNTTDHHFIVDKHPNHQNVFLASPCSGHGYKFCTVIGEILADLVLQGHSLQQKDILRLRRQRPGFEELFERFEQSQGGDRSRL